MQTVFLGGVGGGCGRWVGSGFLGMQDGAGDGRGTEEGGGGGGGGGVGPGGMGREGEEGGAGGGAAAAGVRPVCPGKVGFSI